MDGAGGGRGGLQHPISVLSSWLLPTPFFIFLLPPPLPSLQLCYSTLNIDIMVLLPSFLTHTAGRTPTAASLTSDEQQQQEASQRHYHQRHYVSGVCKAAWYRQQCWRCCGVAEPGRGPCPPRSVLGGAWDCSCAAHGCARCGQQ